MFCTLSFTSKQINIEFICINELKYIRNVVYWLLKLKDDDRNLAPHILNEKLLLDICTKVLANINYNAWQLIFLKMLKCMETQSYGN